MDDHEFVSLNPVINEIRIAGRRQDANTGDISLAPEIGIFGKQQACGSDFRRDGGCRTWAEIRNVFVDISNVGVSLRRKAQPHRPHFFQSAAISSSLTYSPRSASE